jgi:hypothetical protein
MARATELDRSRLIEHFKQVVFVASHLRVRLIVGQSVTLHRGPGLVHIGTVGKDRGVSTSSQHQYNGGKRSHGLSDKLNTLSLCKGKESLFCALTLEHSQDSTALLVLDHHRYLQAAVGKLDLDNLG